VRESDVLPFDASARALDLGVWRGTDDRGRFLRTAAIVVLALAVHVAATAVFSASQPQRRASPPAISGVTTLRLIGTQAQAAAATAPTQSTTRPHKLDRAHAGKPAPIAARPRVKENAPIETAPAHAPAPAAAAQPPAIEYQIARRSLAFAGRRARDESPPSDARPLDAWLSEGIARSVWAVANELAAAGDGRCEISGHEPQFVCSSAELHAALARIAQPAQRALASWVRGGFVQAIELQFEAGRAMYALR
jgi:hypothetical protein